MMSLVRFRTAEGTFLAPTERVLEVRRAEEVKGLPGRKDGVAGLIERNGQALSVSSTLGKSGRHVLVLTARGSSFGLLAEEVFGVVSVSELDIEPAPVGQKGALVAGVVKARGGLELIVSVDALWGELEKPPA